MLVWQGANEAGSRTAATAKSQAGLSQEHHQTAVANACHVQILDSEGITC